MKKFLYLFITLLLLLAGSFIFRSLFWYGEISITGIDGYSYVSINNIENDTEMDSLSLKLRPGKYSVYIHSPLRKEPVDQSVEVKPFEKILIDALDEQLTDQELVNELTFDEGARNSLQVSKYLLSNTKTWLVARLYSLDGNSEGYTNIYKFTPSSGWKVVESGTGIEPETLEKLEAPEEIVNFIRGDS